MPNSIIVSASRDLCPKIVDKTQTFISRAALTVYLLWSFVGSDKSCSLGSVLCLVVASLSLNI